MSLKAAMAVCWAVLALTASVRWLLPHRPAGRAMMLLERLHSREWSWSGLAHAAAGHAAALFAVAVACWAAWRVGRLLARWLGIRAAGPGGQFFEAALGLGLAGFLLQGFGLTGLWFPTVVIAAPLLAAMLAGGSLAPRLRVPSLAAGPGVMIFLAAAILVFAATRVPLGARGVDAMQYHIAMPEHFLLTHRIGPAPWQPQWHLPFNVDALSGPAVALGATEGAKTLGLIWWLTGAGLIVWLARLAGARRGGAGWMLACYAGLGQALVTTWYGKNDLGGTVMTLACAGCLWRAALSEHSAASPPRKSNSSMASGPVGWWAAAGLTGAWAVLGKPLNVLYLATGLLALPALGRWSWRSFRGSALVLLVSGLAAGAVWPLKNLLWTGDPFYPTLSSRLGVMSSWRTTELADTGHTAGLLKLMIAPADWPALAARLADVTWLPYGSLALGILAPWLFLSRCPVPHGRWLKLVIAGGSIAILALTGTSRYLLPGTLLACVLAGLALEPGARWLRPAAALGWLALAASSASVILARSFSPDALARLAGQVSRQEFNRGEFSSFQLLRETIREKAPRSGAILLLGETRRTGFARRMLAASTYSAQFPEKLSREAGDVASLARKFRQHGIGIVVYNCVSSLFSAVKMYSGAPWKPEQVSRYRSFFAAHAELIAAPPLVDSRNGGFYMWRITRLPGTPASRLEALPGAEGALAQAMPRLGAAGGLDSALNGLENARGRFGGVGEYHGLVGMLAIAARRFDLAYSELDAALKCGFIGENTLSQHLNLLIWRREFSSAESLVRLGESVYPPKVAGEMKAVYHVARAHDFLRRGLKEAAREHLDRARRAGARTADQFLALAEGYRAVGEERKEREAAARAKELR